MKTGSPTFLYLATTLANQLAPFAVLPVVTHYLSPDAYGKYVMVLSLVAVVDVLASSWVRNVTFRIYYELDHGSRLKQLYGTAIIYQASAFLLAFAGGTLLSFGRPILGLSDSLLGVGMVMMMAKGLHAVGGNFLRAAELSGPFAWSEISGAVTRVGMTIVTLAMGFRTPAALLLASGTGSLLAGAWAFVALRRTFSGRGWWSKTIAREITRLGLPSIPFSLGVWGISLSDRLLLGAMKGPVAVGLYAVSYTATSRIIGGIGSAVFMAAWPRIASVWSTQSRNRVRTAIAASIALYFWMTVGPMVFLFTFGSVLLTQLVGHNYDGAVAILPWIAMGAWVNGLTGFVNRPLELEKRYSTMSILVLTAAGVNLGLNLLLIPRLGVGGTAAATLLSYVVYLLLTAIVIDRGLIRISVAHVILPVLVSILALVVYAWRGRADWLGAISFVMVYGLIAAPVVLTIAQRPQTTRQDSNRRAGGAE